MNEKLIVLLLRNRATFCIYSDISLWKACTQWCPLSLSNIRYIHWHYAILTLHKRFTHMLPLDFQLFNCSGHFKAAQTLTLDSMWLPIPIQAYCFFTDYCMNFIIFLCVTFKLFSLGFVHLLTPNPSDATDLKWLNLDLNSLHHKGFCTKFQLRTAISIAYTGYYIFVNVGSDDQKMRMPLKVIKITNFGASQSRVHGALLVW